MLSNEIHNAYLSVKGKDGQEKLHPAGRFMVNDGHIHHLEDYHGLLQKEIPEGVIDDYSIAKMAHTGSNLKVAGQESIKSGHRLDVVPEAELSPMAPAAAVTPKMVQQHILKKPPSVWHYTRAGHDTPHVLEARNGKYMLDGNSLKDNEVATILDNVRSRTGKIRYISGGAAESVAKMEQVFASLRKSDEPMDAQQAFKHLHEAAQAGHVPHAAVEALRRQIYTDPMAQGLGNKYAFNEFHAKQKPGVYISMDGNDFKHINDVHGHEAGDAAIKAFGHAAREAMDESVGSDKAKLWRNPDEQNLYRSGGDEFVAHVPSHEHAATFARALRAKLEQIPAINGTHKLSMSMGFGNDFHNADKALYKAKEQKYVGTANVPGRPQTRAFSPGQVPNLAHSLVPGHEGPVALEQSQLHMTPPALEQRAPAPTSLTSPTKTA